MSSTILGMLNKINEDKHRIGDLNQWNHRIVNQGAKVADETIENFSIVELDFNAEGERICRYLTDTTKKGYLIASVEDYMEEYEGIGNFYNEKDEMARIVILEDNMRMDVSDYVLDDDADGAKEIANGMHVFWDADKKTYIVCNGVADNTNYATAGNKFIVVDPEATYIDGKTLIRLETVVE